MRPALRSLATLAVVLVMYYVVPVGELPSTASAVISVVSQRTTSSPVWTPRPTASTSR